METEIATDLLTDQQRAALDDLFRIALDYSGTSSRVARFLLACWNADENGGWDPIDMWAYDPRVADEVWIVLDLVCHAGHYFDVYGYGDQITDVWRRYPPQQKTDPTSGKE